MKPKKKEKPITYKTYLRNEKNKEDIKKNYNALIKILVYNYAAKEGY